MNEQDVNVEVAEWGLIITMREGFTLNDDNVFTTIDLVFNKQKKYRKNNIIIDWRLTIRNVSFYKLLMGVEHLKMLTLSSGFHKQAFIIQKQDDPENLLFVETVAYNHAIHIRYFYDMESALEWMVGNDN